MTRSRREIVDQVFARFAARGAALDRDPEFLTLVELWIEDKIDMAEVRARYGELLRRQRDNQKATRASLQSTPSLGSQPVEPGAPDDET
jgi:hypothetical protein